MPVSTDNIALIGMPGAGKSTLGVIRRPNQDLAGLLEERRPLYDRWA